MLQLYCHDGITLFFADSLMSLRLLLVFAIAEFLLSLTPGPAVLLVVSQGNEGWFQAEPQRSHWHPNRVTDG